jgi:hypothetical protein
MQRLIRLQVTSTIPLPTIVEIARIAFENTAPVIRLARMIRICIVWFFFRFFSVYTIIGWMPEYVKGFGRIIVGFCAVIL